MVKDFVRSNKFIIKFLLMLFLISFFIGIYLYLVQDTSVKSGISLEVANMIDQLNVTNQNNIIFHILLLSSLTILSIFVIGLPFLLFYYFYEGISIGFLIASFGKYLGIKGVVWGSIFVLVNKLIFLLFVIVLSIYTINYVLKIIKKNNIYRNVLIINHLYRSGIILFLIIINDIILYFGGNKIINLFSFVIA